MLNYKKRSVSTNIFGKLILVFLFLGAMDFLSYNYYWFFLAFLFFVMGHKADFYIDLSVFVLLLFSLFVLIFNNTYQQSITFMLKPFLFPIVYCIGYNTNFIRSQEETPLFVYERNTEKSIFVIAAGFILHFLLNAIININSTNRNTMDIWSGAEASATRQAALACIMLGIIAAFIFSDTNKKNKVFAIIILLLIILYNLVLAGRTIFILFIILMLFAFFYQAICTKKNIIKLSVILVLVCLFIILLYINDVFGMKTFIENSNFYNRFFTDSATMGIEEDSRLEYKLKYLEYFFDYPFGGRYIYNKLNAYSHDLYLDTYDESGIFAFICIIVYVLFSLKRMISCMRNKNISFATRQLMACVYLAINIIFWLEPIMSGLHDLLASYCFIDGTVAQMLHRTQNLKINRKEANYGYRYENSGN